MEYNDKSVKLLGLVREHPDLPIVPMVDSEIVGSDGYDWWVGSITDAKIGKYAISEYGDGSAVIWNDDL